MIRSQRLSATLVEARDDARIDIARHRPLVAVTGGRDFTHRTTVWQALDAVRAELGQFTLIHGAAPGADELARRWAERRGVNQRSYPAAWKLYGKKAGPIRNQMMIDAGPIVLVAFPGGTGTADMVTRAGRAGIEVRHIEGPAPRPATATQRQEQT